MVVVKGLIDGDLHLQVVVVLDKVVEVVVELIDGKLAHGNRVLWKLLVEALCFVGVDVEVERVRRRKQRRKQQWPEVGEHCVGAVCYCDLSCLVFLCGRGRGRVVLSVTWFVFLLCFVLDAPGDLFHFISIKIKWHFISFTFKTFHSLSAKRTVKRAQCNRHSRAQHSNGRCR